MNSLPGYDAWKLRSPYDEHPWIADEEAPEQPLGRCDRCKGSGWMVCYPDGRYAGAGPLPEYSSSRHLHDARCNWCGGSGEYDHGKHTR
jgi:hypothetical protein